MNNEDFLIWIQDEIASYACSPEFKRAVVAVSERAANGERLSTEEIAIALNIPLSLLKAAVGQATEMQAHVVRHKTIQ